MLVVYEKPVTEGKGIGGGKQIILRRSSIQGKQLLFHDSLCCYDSHDIYSYHDYAGFQSFLLNLFLYKQLTCMIELSILSFNKLNMFYLPRNSNCGTPGTSFSGSPTILIEMETCLSALARRYDSFLEE